MNREGYFNQLLSIHGDDDFLKLALEVFRYQSLRNAVYSQFITGLNIDPDKIHSLTEIPFLPTICPKNVILGKRKKLFFSIIFRLVFHNALKTSCKFSICSSNVFE